MGKTKQSDVFFHRSIASWQCNTAYFFNNDLLPPGFNNGKSWNPRHFFILFTNYAVSSFVCTTLFILFEKQQFYIFWKWTKSFGIWRTYNKIDRNCIFGIKTIPIGICNIPVNYDFNETFISLNIAIMYEISFKWQSPDSLLKSFRFCTYRSVFER